jgi:hypothetical protein
MKIDVEEGHPENDERTKPLIVAREHELPILPDLEVFTIGKRGEWGPGDDVVLVRYEADSPALLVVIADGASDGHPAYPARELASVVAASCVQIMKKLLSEKRAEDLTGAILCRALAEPEGLAHHVLKTLSSARIESVSSRQFELRGCAFYAMIASCGGRVVGAGGGDCFCLCKCSDGRRVEGNKDFGQDTVGELGGVTLVCEKDDKNKRYLSAQLMRLRYVDEKDVAVALVGSDGARHVIDYIRFDLDGELSNLANASWGARKNPALNDDISVARVLFRA